MARKKQQKQTVDPACEVLEAVPLASISLEGLQRRAAIDKETVDEYAEVYRAAPDRMPPAKGVKDVGGVVHLWDGHHRKLAAASAGLREIKVLVRRGTLGDAEWLACSANKDQHAQPRKNADKRRAVEAALAARPDESNRLIADHCGVSEGLVRSARDELTAQLAQSMSDNARKGKDGRTIDTTNIGKPAPLPESPGLDSPLSVAMHAQDEAAARKKGLDDVAGVIAAEKEAAIARVVSSGRTGIMEAVEHCRALGCEEEAERLLGALGGPGGEEAAEAPDEEDAEGEGAAVYDAAPAAEPAPPESKPKARPAAAQTDAWGIPVQPHAEEAFAAIPKFNEVLKRLNDLQADLSDLADGPAGEYLRRYMNWSLPNGRDGEGRWVMAELKNAVTNVRVCKPALTECPHACVPHPPHGDECPVCKGRRWVGDPKAHRVESLRKEVEAHYGVGEAG